MKPVKKKVEGAGNTPLKFITPHETHFACDMRIKEFGGKTIGCCCVGHECSETSKWASEWETATTLPPKTLLEESPKLKGDIDESR